MSDTATTAKPFDGKPAADAKTAADIKPAPKLPGASGLEIDKAAAAANAEGERNAVFTSLVTGDSDIVGLVAYSVYKQNKHDWLVAFYKSKSREPDDAELFSYIVGESTPRRLAIYRHLAEATLEGRGPSVNVGPSSEKIAHRASAIPQGQVSSGGSGGALAWIVAAVVAVGAVLLAGKYGIPGLR